MYIKNIGHFKTILRIIIATLLALLLKHILITKNTLLIKLNNFTISIFAKVFNPRISYSSYLILYSIIKEGINYSKCIDFGCGCGILTIFLTFMKNYVLAIDELTTCIINTKLNCKLLNLDSNVDYLVTNSLNCIREKSIDLVITNPPYLPCLRNISSILCSGIYLDLVVESILNSLKICRKGIMFTLSIYSFVKYFVDVMNLVSKFHKIQLVKECDLLIDKIYVYKIL